MEMVSLARSFQIPLLVSFANNEPCAAGAPPRMKLILPYPNFRGSAKILRVREEHEIGYFVHYHTLSGDFRRKALEADHDARESAGCTSSREAPYRAAISLKEVAL